jgi:DNA helicase HerA-like ATPase
MAGIIPKAALEQHIAILGKTGSGKTYAAKGLVERMLDDGRQVCVIDPTAAWWGLRLGANGKPPGFLLGALRTAGLIDYPSPGMVDAAEWLREAAAA